MCVCVQIWKMGEGEHKFVTEIPNDFQNVCGLFPLYAFKNSLHYCCNVLIEHELNNFVNAMS